MSIFKQYPHTRTIVALMTDQTNSTLPSPAQAVQASTEQEDCGSSEYLRIILRDRTGFAEKLYNALEMEQLGLGKKRKLPETEPSSPMSPTVLEAHSKYVNRPETVLQTPRVHGNTPADLDSV